MIISNEDFSALVDWLAGPPGSELPDELVIKAVRALISERSRALDLYASRDLIAAAAVKQQAELREKLAQQAQTLANATNTINKLSADRLELLDKVRAAEEMAEARLGALRVASNEMEHVTKDRDRLIDEVNDRDNEIINLRAQLEKLQADHDALVLLAKH